MEIKGTERIDSLQRDNLNIIQDPSDFCFGMDAVLLSAFARLKDTDNVLDLCTGNGVIPLLLSARNKGVKEIKGLEIREKSADLAKRSVEMNGLSERIGIVQADVKDAAKIFGASSFSAITCNPPYMKKQSGLKNPDEWKNIARHEELITWKEIVSEVNKLLKEKGRFFFVHRPFRLPELIFDLKNEGLEPKRMRLVYPFIDKEPNMVLMEAVKHGGEELKCEPPLIIYEEPGVYREEVRKLYDE
ncbi:MAG: tRNA1(Val) (adenine(37)-N6)-methyltransferase [Lachnospiraceae bacterium]|nr:tRNA1(Val) (adenine(37)-N6)-methyltransferase [Lachnospiraceae bacterium]